LDFATLVDVVLGPRQLSEVSDVVKIVPEACQLLLAFLIED